jgi:hypothetical protein
MRKEPVISVRAAAGLLEAIKAAGADPDRVFVATGIDGAVFSQLEQHIPVSLFARILEEAARAAGDSNFGLHFGESYNPKNVGPLIYVILNSPTIGLGMENIGRYLRIHNQAAKAELVIEKDRAFQLYARRALTRASRQHSEYAMTVVAGTMRLMVGSERAPGGSLCPSTTGGTPEHLRVFRAPVLFDVRPML